MARHRRRITLGASLMDGGTRAEKEIAVTAEKSKIKPLVVQHGVVHGWRMVALVALALMLAMIGITIPISRAAAASPPDHWADVVYCFGGGNPTASYYDLPARHDPTNDYMEVAAPVVYAVNRNPGTDWQYVTWRADLLVQDGSAWVVAGYGPWAQPYQTPDGEGFAPEFDLAGRVLRGMTWRGLELNRLYSVRITVHWYAVGAVPAFESKIIPSSFNFSSPPGGQWCDYYPDQGFVNLP
jgi:hypothetical protein